MYIYFRFNSESFSVLTYYKSTKLEVNKNKFQNDIRKTLNQNYDLTR